MDKQGRSTKRTGKAGAAKCCPGLEECLDARLFKALADPTRIHILSCLTRCCTPQTVSEVAACCAVDMSVVSRHLTQLRTAGVLSVEKRGRTMHYRVRYGELVYVLRQLAAALEACASAEKNGRPVERGKGGPGIGRQKRPRSGGIPGQEPE